MRYRLLDATGFLEALDAPRAPWIIDLRTPARFAEGHVPGSRNIPVHDLPRRRKDLPPTFIERILLVSDTPKRAEAAANFLALMGFADVSVLEGGIEAFPGELATG